MEGWMRVGGKAERRRLIEAERKLRGAPEMCQWVRAIMRVEETINEVVCVADAPLFSFGRGVDDNLDLRARAWRSTRRLSWPSWTICAHRRTGAEAAAARGLLVRWPECLTRGLQRCVELHAYLDAWASF